MPFELLVQGGGEEHNAPDEHPVTAVVHIRPIDGDEVPGEGDEDRLQCLAESGIPPVAVERAVPYVGGVEVELHEDVEDLYESAEEAKEGAVCDAHVRFLVLNREVAYQGFHELHATVMLGSTEPEPTRACVCVCVCYGRWWRRVLERRLHGAEW